ncbi:MAG TPA: hypothetical protein DDW65_18995 [Firmicutes bacterium]|nr:hypothetical protein [Bacillota bacterium]
MNQFGIYQHSNSKKRVLNSLNFVVFQGESVGIIGPNGLGKTTLFRAILLPKHRH